jgi:hypothetical protein
MSESSNPTDKLIIGDIVVIDYQFFAKRFGAEFINIPVDTPVKGKVIDAKYPGDVDDVDKTDVYTTIYIKIDITSNNPRVQRKKNAKGENGKLIIVDDKPIPGDNYYDLDLVYMYDNNDLQFVTKITEGGGREEDAEPSVQPNRQDAVVPENASEKPDVRQNMRFI